jgi:predicted NUDIX family NTP pyrophosphohydrolase
MIKQFSEFVKESKDRGRDTAGIAIIYQTKILLVHPANGSWVKPIMGIPKGRIEEGEDVKLAAIRETFEETGIQINPDQLEPSPSTVEVFDKNGQYKNSIHYYVCRILDLSEIGLDTLSVPKAQLQKEEVDWAGFVDIKSAYGKVASAQRLILDRLS